MSSFSAASRFAAVLAHVMIGVLALGVAGGQADAQEPRSVKGLATPESVVVGADGRIYVSEIGEFGKDGDGKVTAIGQSGNAEAFASGFDDPKGLAVSGDALYVADKARIWKIDMQGKASVFVAANAFPQPPLFLNDLAFDGSGNLYVSDTGDIEKGGKGAIFRIAPDGKATLVASEASNASIKSPNGLLADGPGSLLVVDFATGELLRLDVEKGSAEKLAEGFGGGDGLVRDSAGMLYVSDWKGGKVYKLNLKDKSAKPEVYAQTFSAAADITLSGDGKFILVPDMKAGALVWLPK